MKVWYACCWKSFFLSCWLSVDQKGGNLTLCFRHSAKRVPEKPTQLFLFMYDDLFLLFFFSWIWTKWTRNTCRHNVYWSQGFHNSSRAFNRKSTRIWRNFRKAWTMLQVHWLLRFIVWLIQPVGQIQLGNWTAFIRLISWMQFNANIKRLGNWIIFLYR